MTIAEQISEILSVPLASVEVKNESGEITVLINGDELSTEQQEQIADVFTPEPFRKLRDQMRAEASQRIEKIAEIIEKAQGQRWEDDKQKIAGDIRNANAQGRG